MRYNISKPSAPKMPNLGKGTECIKILISQASKGMFAPLVPMLFPSLGAHMSVVKIQHYGLILKEMCNKMGCLVAKSRDNKR